MYVESLFKDQTARCGSGAGIIGDNAIAMGTGAISIADDMAIIHTLFEGIQYLKIDVKNNTDKIRLLWQLSCINPTLNKAVSVNSERALFVTVIHL